MSQSWLKGTFAAPLEELKQHMQELAKDLEAADVDADTLSKLRDVAMHIDELFLLVIVGEVKAGKSSLINAIFGAKICPEGVTPTTDKINVLRYGEKPFEKHKGDFLVERFVPFDQLKNVNVVDTPGTNSIIKQHTEISEGFIPRADLILFVTSIDRPYTQTEQDFLRLISERWRKKIIFVLNKIDIKEENEILEVEHYVRENCKSDFGFEPQIFPVSPKLAYKGREAGDDDMWERSRLQAVIDYIFETLTERDKLELKLLSPITAAQHICEEVQKEFKTRLEILEDHSKTLKTIEERVEARIIDIREAYSRHILDVSNLMTDVHNRGVNYLEDAIQIKNFRTLRDRNKFKLEFEKTVVAEFQKDLFDILQRATDELVRKEMSLWSDTFNYYNEWVALERYKAAALGKVSTQFEYNRDKIIHDVQQDWQRNLNSFNYQEQCNRILDQANAGLAQLGGLVLGGTAVGTIAVAATAGFSAIDITGILGGVALAALGLYFVPAKRKKAVKYFRSRFQDLQSSLLRALEQHVDRESRAMRDNVVSKLSPAREHFDIMRKKTEDLSIRIEKHHKRLHEFVYRFRLLLAETYGTEDDVRAVEATAPAGVIAAGAASGEPDKAGAESAHAQPARDGETTADADAALAASDDLPTTAETGSTASADAGLGSAEGAHLLDSQLRLQHNATTNSTADAATADVAAESTEGDEDTPQ